MTSCLTVRRIERTGNRTILMARVAAPVSPSRSPIKAMIRTPRLLQKSAKIRTRMKPRRRRTAARNSTGARRKPTVTSIRWMAAATPGRTGSGDTTGSGTSARSLRMMRVAVEPVPAPQLAAGRLCSRYTRIAAGNPLRLLHICPVICTRHRT